MPQQQKAYKGEITLAFDYKATATSQVVRENIEPERIAYLMIEHKYENVNILPVIYVSINLSSDMFTKVVNTPETSKFYLKIRKKDALSKTSIYKKVLEDTFTYVTSTTSANYSEGLNDNVMKDSTYKTIMIGLVSESMTNQLRQSYNGIYNNIDQNKLVKLALDGLGDTIMQPLDYNNKYKSVLIPPISSRYKLLSFLFDKDQFYNSNFTFFMDFNKTYLVSKNATPIEGVKNVIINIEDYTAADAADDGFTINNGAYILKINANNTNVIVNNALSKVGTNIVNYDAELGVQKFSLNGINNTEGNTSKTIYTRDISAAALKNELDSTSVMLELLKQNIDSEIFTPEKVFDVVNYKDYSKYDGKYILSYKREFFYPSNSGEFILTCTAALKRTGQEELATATEDSYDKNYSTIKGKKSTTAAKHSQLKSVSRSDIIK